MKELRYPALSERLFTESLPCGMSVYALPRPGLAHTAAALTVPYGGMDQRFYIGKQRRRTPEGAAWVLGHALEAAPAGQALRERITQLGGEIRVWVYPDHTEFSLDCRDHFPQCLEALLHFVFAPPYSPEDLERAKPILREMAQDRSAEDKVVMKRALFQMLFPDSTLSDALWPGPEGWDAVTAEVLRLCHETFYQPQRAALCMAGQLDPRAMMVLCASVVRPGKRQPVTRYHGEGEPDLAGGKRQELVLPQGRPACLLGFRCTPDRTFRDLLVGELAAKLTEDRDGALAAAAGRAGFAPGDFLVSYESYDDAALFLMGGACPDPRRAADVLLEEGIPGLGTDWSEGDFARRKKASYGRRVRAMDDLADLCRTAVRAQSLGSPYPDFAQLYQEISLREVQARIARCITGEGAALVLLNRE